ncbi:MAG: ATP-binding protein [Nanoarchaeota archaeon]|nr:ATP-binding protein [Nanoarchaeota archaeon]
MNERITEALERSNKWWKEEYEIEFKDREIYEHIKEFIEKRQILALVGLRRTGKTTIMQKIILDSLKEFGKRNVVYFSFDDFREVRLLEVIKSYESIMNKKISEGKYLFLFDEIQKVDHWEEQLKRFYDENPRIKFIISGSESLFLRKNIRESLAGRMYEFNIRTLSFKEFLLFKGKKYDNLNLYKEELLKDLRSYLYSNGFPEIINESKEISEKYLKENVIEKILYKDIPQIVSIRDPSLLEQIFNIILNDPGQLINFDDLARDLGISRQTASIYISYLEKAFLIRKIYNYSRNTRKTQKGMKKYYPIVLPIGLIDKKESFGKVFETFIINQLQGEFFWRDTFKNEIDLVLQNPVIGMEIKSGEIKEKDLVPLQKFSEKFNPKYKIIISYNLESKINGVDIVPFYKYLLRGESRAKKGR